MPEINPAYFDAVAREERNRYRAYLDRAPALELPLRSGGHFAFPIVTLRWRHVLELLQSGNAFLSGQEPLPGDFEELLWRLHPFFRTTSGHYANLRPHDLRPLALYSFLARILIRIAAAQLIRPAAEKVIRLYFRDAQQDRPSANEGSGAEEASAAAPTLTQLDLIAGRLGLAGWSRAAILEENIAYTYQILRTADLLEGKGDQYVPPSAQLLKFVPAS